MAISLSQFGDFIISRKLCQMIGDLRSGQPNCWQSQVLTTWDIECQSCIMMPASLNTTAKMLCDWSSMWSLVTYQMTIPILQYPCSRAIHTLRPPTNYIARETVASLWFARWNPPTLRSLPPLHIEQASSPEDFAENRYTVYLKGRWWRNEAMCFLETVYL